MIRHLRHLVHRVTPRPLRRRIGVRVLAGFSVTALLAMVVALLSLSYSTAAGRDLAQVTERDRKVAADFSDLDAAVEQQSGAVQNFLLSGDDRDLEALRAGRDRFTAALARLQGSLPAEERGPSMTELRRQAQEFDDIAAEEIALYRQGWTRSANFLWRTDGQQTKQRLLSAVQRQVDEHNSAVDRDIALSRSHLRTVYGLSLSLVLLAAALVFVVGMTITRAVTRPVQQLMKVAAAVRNGNYTVRAPVTGEDELAVLTLAMNAMVHSLAVSRAELEHALAETERSEKKYRLLTDNANDIIFAIDTDHRITFINPAVRRLLGYEPDDLIGQPTSVVLTEETLRQVQQNDGWETREPESVTVDIAVRAVDGRIVPMEINSTVLRMNGEPVGLHGIARDMTERHRMEQELRRLHAQDQRRVDQLVTVNEVGRKIAALQPLDALLPHLVQMLGKTFCYDHVRILLVTEAGELGTAASWSKRGGHDVTVSAANGASALLVGESMASMPLSCAVDLVDGSAAASVARSSPADVSPLALRALEGDAGWVAGSGRPEDDAATRFTEVAVPVRTKSQVLGVLDIRGAADGGVDESDIFTLQTLADQIAVAIENARLYEAGQQLAVSEERNRLARELHDSVTQELFSMTMIAGSLPKLIAAKPDKALERSGRLYELARGALAEMRALLFALRPAALQEEGLVSAVTKHAAGFENQEGVQVHVEIARDCRLPQAVEEALYRVTQEALNNIAKHARAKTAWITLAIEDDRTTLTIRDDGVGIDPAALPAGGVTMGLKNMRERVEGLGGTCIVERTPGAGTTIRAIVPVGAAQLVPA